MARTHPQHPRPPHTHHPLGPCLVVAATINDATRFGTSKHPATKDQFKVGDPVRVTATISGPSITATQIRTPADHQPHSAP
jgi:hypothetical protein